MAGASQKADEPITEINVTPLVDVCLVLVIIFMAVAPFAMVAGIKVLESKAQASEGKVSANDNVNIKLTEDGKVAVNGAEVPMPSLRQEVAKALSASKDKMVILTADDGNRVGDVVSVLDTAKQAGAVKVAILKSEEAPKAGKKA